MALIKCRECNNQISNQAAVCPHCGVPIKRSFSAPVTRGLAVFLLILGLFFVFFFITKEPEKVQPKRPAETDEMRHAGRIDAWLRNYYRQYPIGLGWTVTDIGRDGFDYIIDIDIPTDHANWFSTSPEPKRKAAVSVACPGPDEKIFKMLYSKERIVIQLSNQERIFMDYSCR
jgi:hypothetical protein